MAVHADCQAREARLTLSSLATFILAGGLGNRLYPLTQRQAKPAVSFGGSGCLLDLTLLNCYRSGLGRVYILAQYQVASLIERVRTGWAAVEDRGAMAVFFRLPRSLGTPFRGTADAVWHNLDVAPASDDADVLILAGDHVYAMDYGEFLAYHRGRGADLTIGASLVPASEVRRFGVLDAASDGRVTAFWEKPDSRLVRPVRMPRVRPSPSGGRAPFEWVRASMGIYAFRASVLHDVLAAGPGSNRGFDFGKDIIPAMVGSRRVFAFDFVDARSRPRYWRDVGTVSAYYDAQMDMVCARPPFRVEVPAGFPRSRLTECRWDPARRCLIATASEASGELRSSVVAPDAIIEGGAVVERSVVLENAVIEAGATLRGAVVGPFARVKKGAFVGGAARACAVGRVYRTLGGIAIVPAEETVAPERPTARAFAQLA
jgi:glucose-1-phosphate adenylyltransferase